MIRRQRWPMHKRRWVYPKLHLHWVVRWMVAGAMAMAAVLLVLRQSDIRPFEARAGSAIMAPAQIGDARAIGTAILFHARGVLVGVDITTSCSVALLISPFCLLAGGLILTRRISVSRGLATLGVLVVWLFAVNLTRILVIVLAMREWGLERGYDLTHVLFGTVVSTLGIVGGLVIFLRTMTQAKAPAELRP